MHTKQEINKIKQEVTKHLTQRWRRKRKNKKQETDYKLKLLAEPR